MAATARAALWMTHVTYIAQHPQIVVALLLVAAIVMMLIGVFLRYVWSRPESLDVDRCSSGSRRPVS